MTTLYYYHKDFMLHKMEKNHPESPERITHIDSALQASQFKLLKRIQPVIRQDVLKQIKLVHSQSMIDIALQEVDSDELIKLNEVSLSHHSSHAALLAVSSVCDAVDEICTNNAKNAFCAVRPPGHHAEPNESMGFCIFNNIAIAALYAIKHHGLKRVAIIDFDVHHGNGTQAAFFNNPAVFYASTHEMPLYPHSGDESETGVGNIFNLPLNPFTGSQEFREKYTQTILPALDKFAPELVLISAGFDAHEDDRLSTIQLTSIDYGWVTEEIMEIAERHCNGKIISVLEGGYELNSLAESVKTHIHALMK